MTMILLTHIIIALASFAYTTLLLFRPSLTKLYVSYAFVAATLASGIYLTIVNPASMLHTCTTGLVYIVIVTAGITIARKKLTTAHLATEESQQ